MGPNATLLSVMDALTRALVAGGGVGDCDDEPWIHDCTDMVLEAWASLTKFNVGAYFTGSIRSQTDSTLSTCGAHVFLFVAQAALQDVVAGVHEEKERAAKEAEAQEKEENKKAAKERAAKEMAAKEKASKERAAKEKEEKENSAKEAEALELRAQVKALQNAAKEAEAQALRAQVKALQSAAKEEKENSAKEAEALELRAQVKALQNAAKEAEVQALRAQVKALQSAAKEADTLALRAKVKASPEEEAASHEKLMGACKAGDSNTVVMLLNLHPSIVNIKEKVS
eukprot:gene437-1835_t